MKYSTDRVHVGIQLGTAVGGGLALAVVALAETHRPFGSAHLHYTLSLLLGLPGLGVTFFAAMQLMRTTVHVTETDVEWRALCGIARRSVPIGDVRSLVVRVTLPVAGPLARLYLRGERHLGLVGMSPAALGLLWDDLARRRALCCDRCGYGLRATPDCCPECGAVPSTAPGYDR